MVTALFTVQCF